jgi:dicarboxylate transporter 10
MTDTAKVRLQTRALDGPKGMINTFVHIFRNNGFLGLYSGVRAILRAALLLPDNP